MNLVRVILLALSKHQGKPVVIPVIVLKVRYSLEMMGYIRQNPEIQKLREIGWSEERIERRIDRDLPQKVRMVLPKLAMSGRAKPFYLSKLRKIASGSEKKFRELVTRSGVVFTDSSQLDSSQTAYQITSKGLRWWLKHKNLP